LAIITSEDVVGELIRVWYWSKKMIEKEGSQSWVTPKSKIVESIESILKFDPEIKSKEGLLQFLPLFHGDDQQDVQLLLLSTFLHQGHPLQKLPPK
jgi:hypothetical protein